MSNATTLQFGANNNGTDRNELFMEVYGGEVMAAFEEQNEMLDKHMIRHIDSGKSAQFPATWKLAASYHTPGTEIVGQTSPVSERTILIDDLLISDAFIANIDEAKSHFEVRSAYSVESGRALKRTFNANIMAVALLAARASATVTGGFGGSTLTAAGFANDGAVIAAGFFDAGQAMDEKDVPSEQRFGFLKPAQYNLVVQNKDAINRDWDGNGSYSKGKVYDINDIAVVKSNNLPSTNIATGPLAYRGNFTTVKALWMHYAAVGTVKLLDLALDMGYDMRRQGTLLISKYAMGHGVLRPECAVEGRTAAPV